MPRRPRLDRPGAWHHVVNRGLAKRPLFESRMDKRSFLARLACQVRASRLEVHSYSLLTTHFHMLVSSPIGELSEALRQLQSSYSRRFNRTRDRDGPLVRGRFFSKRVDSDAYRRAVVQYIDHNAVQAGLVETPWEYEFGSARAWMSGKCPPWVSCAWIPPRAMEWTHLPAFGPEAYVRAFTDVQRERIDELCELVEARLKDSESPTSREDTLIHTSQGALEWLQSRAQLGDGQDIGLPICVPRTLDEAIAKEVADRGDWPVGTSTKARRGSEVAQVALLSTMCKLSESEVMRRCHLSRWHVRSYLELHRVAVLSDAEHPMRCAAIASEAGSLLTLPS